MIITRQSPRDQGADQAAALAADVRSCVAGLRAERGWLAWRLALHAARRGPGRSLSRFTPQLHERLQGIAEGSRVPVAALELGESLWRGRATCLAKDGLIEGNVAAPPGLALFLRRSEPDAGGFSSVELTAAPLASAFAGVNSEGIAAACVDDGPVSALPARLLVQDLLFRTRTFETAIEHVRRRAHYLGTTGALVVCASGAGAALLELRAGRLSRGDASLAQGGESDEFRFGLGDGQELRIDAGSRELSFHGAGGCARAPE